ncbi:hypothetical protein BUALT_Bualt10G0007200 [Buddleja alternifolia]|uniref:Protein FAR1-RELATED SEQUENCE n=1 Tax=Buddleja alternifolia TaxID=168488 RepID=A0AAV6X299_9LAMI|nr:hypothetical protein BUALT_Bualt10G0007200 [Buddleja alternifolia]
MEFNNEEVASEFYNEYASAIGFNIRKHASHKDINDGQMMANYMNFTDVICSDTTYMKNKERRPCALFLGLNYHKQIMVFGAALLYDEIVQTFMCLFDTFARGMSGRDPETILTDQDAAMAKVLAEKWLKTCHNLDFNSCIYDYEEEDDFIDAWHEMLEKYNLQNND